MSNRQKEIFFEVVIGILFITTFLGTAWLMVETGKKVVGVK